MKTENRINRVPVQMMTELTGNEYKVLDHLLYKSNLNGWTFWTTEISKNTGVSIGTCFTVLQSFVILGWVRQDDKHHYSFEYNKCVNWMFQKMKNVSGIESTPDKVEIDPKVSVPERKVSGIETIVSGIESTRSTKNNVQEVLKSTVLSGIENVDIANVSAKSNTLTDYDKCFDKLVRPLRYGSPEYKNALKSLWKQFPEYELKGTYRLY